METVLFMTNVIPADVETDIYNKLNKLTWYVMTHNDNPVSRKVRVEGDSYQIINGLLNKSDKSTKIKPLYRYPTDTLHDIEDWSPTVKTIRDYLQSKYSFNLNQAKIQLYENGMSHITNHSDKTLDIRLKSKIVNLSFGADRTFVFTDKITKTKYEYKMPNNSMIVFDTEINKRFWHKVIKNPICNQGRISIVFRDIGTFILEDKTLIGQGALKKPRTNEKQIEELKKAFSDENNYVCNYEDIYSDGFSVLCIK